MITDFNRELINIYGYRVYPTLINHLPSHCRPERDFPIFVFFRASPDIASHGWMTIVSRQTSNRGFAGMDEDKQREIAAKGGQASGGNFTNDLQSFGGR